jgi:hypothetical protein
MFCDMFYSMTTGGWLVHPPQGPGCAAAAAAATTSQFFFATWSHGELTEIAMNYSTQNSPDGQSDAHDADPFLGGGGGSVLARVPSTHDTMIQVFGV